MAFASVDGRGVTMRERPSSSIVLLVALVVFALVVILGCCWVVVRDVAPFVAEFTVPCLIALVVLVVVLAYVYLT